MCVCLSVCVCLCVSVYEHACTRVHINLCFNTEVMKACTMTYEKEGSQCQKRASNADILVLETMTLTSMLYFSETPQHLVE